MLTRGANKERQLLAGRHLRVWVPLDHAGQQSCSYWTKSLTAQVKAGSAQRYMEVVALECAEAARCATEQGLADHKHTLVSDVVAFDIERGDGASLEALAQRINALGGVGPPAILVEATELIARQATQEKARER